MKESAAFLSKLTQLASPVPFSLALSHSYHASFIQLFSDGSSRSRRASSCGDLLSLSWTLLGPPLICKFVCGLADRILGVKWQIMIGSARVRQSVFKFRRERESLIYDVAISLCGVGNRRCSFIIDAIASSHMRLRSMTAQIAYLYGKGVSNSTFPHKKSFQMGVVWMGRP